MASVDCVLLWSGAVKSSVAALEKHGLEVSCPEGVVLHHVPAACTRFVIQTAALLGEGATCRTRYHRCHPHLAREAMLQNLRRSVWQSESERTDDRKGLQSYHHSFEALGCFSHIIQQLKDFLPAEALLQALWKLVGDEPSEVPRLRRPRQSSFFL